MSRASRSILRRPERKPPQLLKVPFYEEAARAFRDHCPDMQFSLELERTETFGQPTWTISAYSGPRSSSGLTINHVIERTERVLTLEEVKCAAASLGATSRHTWEMRRRRDAAKAALEKAGKGIGRIVHVD